VLLVTVQLADGNLFLSLVAGCQQTKVYEKSSILFLLEMENKSPPVSQKTTEEIENVPQTDSG
jgi:hypothetical protein